MPRYFIKCQSEVTQLEMSGRRFATSLVIVIHMKLTGQALEHEWHSYDNLETVGAGFS
jgi:hypothetical protein